MPVPRKTPSARLAALRLIYSAYESINSASGDRLSHITGCKQITLGKREEIMRWVNKLLKRHLQSLVTANERFAKRHPCPPALRRKKDSDGTKGLAEGLGQNPGQ